MFYDPQTPLCTEEHFDCVSSTKVDDSDCLQQCSGLIVTSYDQQDIEDKFRKKLVESFGKGTHSFRNIAKELRVSCQKSLIIHQ